MRSCSVTAERLLSPGQGSQMAVEQHQCGKAGVAGKRSKVAGRILPKILLKQNPRLTLSAPETARPLPREYERWLIEAAANTVRTRAKR